jgi:predicted XRE-type DNA-binding protein
MLLTESKKSMDRTVFEESSGNIFADLGFDDADEMLMRGKIGIQVVRLLRERNVKQREAAELLGVSQPEVSHLMKGEFQRFSEGKLLTFLKRLDTEITLHIRPQNTAENIAIPSSNLSSETWVSL